MIDQFLGEIAMFGSNFPPKGWMACDGRLLPIAQNQALFALLGTTYGGDGRTTFALPDLRGCAPIHMDEENPLGARQTAFSTGVQSPNDGPGYLAITFCIAVQGIFPSQS